MPAFHCEVQAVDAVVRHFDDVALLGESLAQIGGQPKLVLDHEQLHGFTVYAGVPQKMANLSSSGRVSVP